MNDAGPDVGYCHTTRAARQLRLPDDAYCQRTRLPDDARRRILLDDASDGDRGGAIRGAAGAKMEVSIVIATSTP